MSIAGAPMDHGDQGRQDDGRATPAGGPPNDWDKEFGAIVSGITGDMHWAATAEDLDRAADTEAAAPRPITRAPDSIWVDAAPDTAEARRQRRELRRAEREESLAAFRQAQEEVAAARAADTEHFVPPEPPPMPRLKRRTVGALAMIVIGLVLVIFPVLLPAPLELVAVFGALLILGGAAVLLAGIRNHHGDGWDSGSGS